MTLPIQCFALFGRSSKSTISGCPVELGINYVAFASFGRSFAAALYMSAETNGKTKAWVQNLYAAECQQELVRDDLLFLAHGTVDSGWKVIKTVLLYKQFSYLRK